MAYCLQRQSKPVNKSVTRIYEIKRVAAVAFPLCKNSRTFEPISMSLGVSH